MTGKVTVQRNAFAESLAIVGRAVSSHAYLPVLSNVLLRMDEGQLRLAATDLTIGVTVWMDANLTGELGLTLPAKTLTDVVNSLNEPEVVFSVNGKPEASVKCGSYKGIIKGIEASEFPEIPQFDVSSGVLLDASALKTMIQNVAFAASLDDSRPVSAGVLLNIKGMSASMVATDGFRLAIAKTELAETLGDRQLIIPASALKEVLKILGATKSSKVRLFLPSTGNQVVFRLENVQLVSQLIDGRFPDYQTILPKGYKTRTVVKTSDLLKAGKQASIIARDGNNVVRVHLQPGMESIGKVRLLAESTETGASEIELSARVEGQELEIGFNVKFLLDALEVISTREVVIETNSANTPAVFRPVGEDGYLYLIMPMHMD